MNIDTSILLAFFLRRKILSVIRHNRYLNLGNGSNKFGNHCPIKLKNLLMPLQAFWKFWGGQLPGCP